MIERDDQLVTSSLTIGKILTKSLSIGGRLDCEQYEEIIRATAIVVDFDIAAAQNFAKLRSRSKELTASRCHPVGMRCKCWSRPFPVE
jgi:predicted nucleic acid-binding protein